MPADLIGPPPQQHEDDDEPFGRQDQEIRQPAILPVSDDEACHQPAVEGEDHADARAVDDTMGRPRRPRSREGSDPSIHPSRSSGPTPDCRHRSSMGLVPTVDAEGQLGQASETLAEGASSTMGTPLLLAPVDRFRVVGHGTRDLQASCLLDLGGGHLLGLAVAVDHQAEPIAGDAHLVEVVERAGRSGARRSRLEDQQDDVGLVEDLRLIVAERVVEVDDHVGEHGAGQWPAPGGPPRAGRVRRRRAVRGAARRLTPLACRVSEQPRQDPIQPRGPFGRGRPAR